GEQRQDPQRDGEEAGGDRADPFAGRTKHRVEPGRIPIVIAAEPSRRIVDHHHRAVAGAAAAQSLELAFERRDRSALDTRVERGDNLGARPGEQRGG
ncbi:hypothetical protein QU38_00155, partial [Staphylococcus aureus]